MFFPLTHEDLQGRRWPYVTIAVIVACVLVHIYSDRIASRVAEEYATKAKGAAEFYIQHSYLKAPRELRAAIPMNPAARAMMEESRSERMASSETDQAEQAEQARLDAMVAEMLRVRNQLPWFGWGYIPKDNQPLKLATSLFLHGDWLHLIFNMWFLWLAGCNIEDRWGRILYPIFFLCAGAAAGLTHKIFYPWSAVPLIGASGAIAGAMGAFLLMYARTKIKFLWFWGLQMKFFDAPAYLMLPLWLAVQIVAGVLAMSAGDAVGVAFWAHVGGFAFGLVAAVSVRRSGLESKIDEAIEGEISVRQNVEIEQASTLIDRHKPREAIAILDGFMRKNPGNVDALLTMLRAAKGVDDKQRELKAYTGLIALYLQQAPDTAIDLYEEMQNLGLDADVPAPLRLRIARQLEKLTFLEGASHEYLNIYSNGHADATSFQALIALANIRLRQKNKKEAIGLFTAAQNSPFPHLEWDATISNGLREADALPDETAQAT